MFTNSVGSVTTNIVILTVGTPPPPPPATGLISLGSGNQTVQLDFTNNIMYPPAGVTWSIPNSLDISKLTPEGQAAMRTVFEYVNSKDHVKK